MNRSSRALLLAAAWLVVVPAIAEEPTAQHTAEAATEADPVVARFGEGDDVVRKSEVDELIAGPLSELRQKEYELRRQAVQGLVLQHVLERRAAAEGVTLEQLLDREIQQKVVAPTDVEIAQAFEQAKGSPQLQGKTLEEVRPQIDGFLRNQQLAQLRDRFLGSTLAASGVRYLFEPPRVEVLVPEGEPTFGPDNAPVTIVEFADYECGYCKRSLPALKQVLGEYPEQVKLVFRDYPLSFHPNARPAAVAARCAGDQDKYWEYHDNLMSEDASPAAENLKPADLKRRAEKLGLDMEQFVACVDSDKHAAAIDTAFNEGSALGVTGTPTFFVNGRRLVGFVTYEQLKQVIEEELGRE